MKIYLFPVVIGGFIITIILQAFMYSTVGLQTAHIQTQLEDINKKIDKLQTVTLNQTNSDISKTKIDTITASAQNIAEEDTGLLSPENLSKTLGATTGGNTVSLKPSWNSVDVYEATKASSKIVGKIDSGKTYQIIEKGKDWYKIKIDSGINAWVQAQFVYETI